MSSNHFSRREFLKRNSLTGLGAVLTPTLLAKTTENHTTEALCYDPLFISRATGIAGGKPVRTQSWPTWPIWKPETDEKQLLEVIRSGVWSRATAVTNLKPNGPKPWVQNVRWRS